MVEEDQPKPSTFAFNCFVGTDRGILKGIDFASETPVCKNFSDDQIRNDSIVVSSLSWKSPTEVLVAFEDGRIANYDNSTVNFDLQRHLDVKSLMVGAHEVEEGRIVYGLSNGKMCLYNTTADEMVLEVKTGKSISSIKQLSTDSTIVALGGEESELQVYDLSEEDPSVPKFKARNVPHDWLELRVPVWVQDMSFMNDSDDLIAICSRHGHCRLYDTKASQRPVIDFEPLEDEALMCICDTGAGQAVVGGNKGTIALVDLRMTGKGKLAHKFSPATGSVRSVAYKNNYVISSSIDRHLYLYNKYEKQVLKKLYLKTRLTQVLMADSFDYATESTAAKTKKRSTNITSVISKRVKV